MGRLHSSERVATFYGFSQNELDAMEKLIRTSREESLEKDFCSKVATNFNLSSARAGKPAVKWTHVQSWFQNRIHDFPSSKIMPSPSTTTVRSERSAKVPEFEARSNKEGAWYDIERFLAYRVDDSGEGEVRVRYVGFGPEEDEWLNIIKSVRERSRSLKSSDCKTINVGDYVVCFQETEDHALHRDAHVLEIKRRRHDIRGCRCVFLVRYDHDNTEEKVRLSKLYCRPTS